MNQHLSLNEIQVDLAGHQIVRNVSFNLKAGQIGSLLGPSGCGKTTLLRTIAGFEPPSSGSIHLRNQLISDQSAVLAPEHRNIGMVFQDLALFPHLTVKGNITFGIRHLSETAQTQRVKELLELVSLSDYIDHYPHQLSGGQQQRIALIRAMAPRPDILLLDEPFSGQDIELREHLAKEVSSILRQDNITALLVTHDQNEAFAFSDVIGVINGGRLHQWDSAYNLYHKPADRFVADFIGQGVFIRATVLDSDSLETELGIVKGEITDSFPPGTEVDLLVRPDDILHDDHSTKQAVVEEKSFRGADHLYRLALANGLSVLCLAPSHHNHDIGERIGITLDLDHLVIFKNGA